MTAIGRWLIFVSLKNPFLHTGHSDFKISIAVIGNSRPTPAFCSGYLIGWLALYS
jgi:hypothetical protein